MLINVQNVIMISDLLKMCALASFPYLYVTTHLRVLSSKNLKKYLYICIFAIDMKTALPSYNFFIGIQHAHHTG